MATVGVKGLTTSYRIYCIKQKSISHEPVNNISDAVLSYSVLVLMVPLLGPLHRVLPSNTSLGYEG